MSARLDRTSRAAASRAAAVGLTDEEYGRIVTLLGREPGDVELGLFGGMWSEHCGYKSSRRYLKDLPTSGPAVLMGPGENAGVVRLGQGWAIALRVESHNHPSAVEPYQGAATGVGGIIRDILTMGARPLAVLDSLRFGPPTDPRARRHFRGVVAGVGGYGNCLGVPTVGGETVFEPGFASNPLVNVMCAGLLRERDLVRGRAEGPGNVLLLLGAPTGRDGIHGASLLASRELAGDDDQRPAVQVGDPFLAKRLLEACLELAASGLLVGMNDLGAAGLTSALSETAARAGSGADVWLDAVPLREPGMSPYEILLSETQERMLAIIAPERLGQAREVCARHAILASEIGRVTDTGHLRVFARGELVADVPARCLTDEAPAYERPARAPRPAGGVEAGEAAAAGGDLDWSAELAAFLASPWLASRRPIYETYDFEVQTNTVAGPGPDAAVLRVRDGQGSGALGFALALDGDSRYGRLDPYYGGAIALAEACRNLACAGAKPLGVADCLNFASPERPETMWAFRQSLAGLAEAARALAAPIVGGNVSFYNETDGVPIPPTPVVGAVGRVPDVRRSRAALRPDRLDGRELWLAGSDTVSRAASAYQFFREGGAGGELPPLDLDQERRVQSLARVAVRLGWATAHDVSAGGLLPALFDLARMAAWPAGVDIELEEPRDIATAFFGEGPARILLAPAPGKAGRLARAAGRLGVGIIRLGVLTPDPRFRVRLGAPGGGSRTVVDTTVAGLAAGWEEGLAGGIRSVS